MDIIIMILHGYDKSLRVICNQVTPGWGDFMFSVRLRRRARVRRRRRRNDFCFLCQNRFS